MKKKYIMLILVIFLIPIMLFNSTAIAKTDINDIQNTNMEYTPQYVVPQFIKYGEYDGRQPKDKPYIYKTVNRNGHYYSGYLYNKGNYYFEGYLYLRENPYLRVNPFE